MSTTRYFTHVDKFGDGTAYIEVGDFGTRLVGTCGAREGSTWTLDECMGNCRAGVWRELSEADVLALNIPAAPVDPRDTEIAALKNDLAEIAAIIESVDMRAAATDGPVTPTLQEMTQEEIGRIYAIAAKRGRRGK